MFNGQYTTIDSVLKGISKYPFVEDLTKGEAAHKLVSLLQLIGATLPLQRTYKTIEIDTHKGELPTGIMYIHGVRNLGTNCVTGKGIVMNYASDIYHSDLHSAEAQKNCAITTPTADDVNDLYGTKPVGGVGELNLPSWAVGETVPRSIAENSYNINGTSIDTSFPYGYVRMAYDAVKLDKDGFPMVPKEATFINAFKYFLLKEAAEPAFFSGDVRKDIYNEIDKQYDFYVGAAQNSFNMPSPDQMQTMINGLVRLLPHANNHSDGWKTFNKQSRF